MAIHGMGVALAREEDLPLIRGRGRYVDDVKEIGELRGYVLRSPHAHARVVSIDVAAARSSPGVAVVLTAAELAKRGLGAPRPSAPRRRKDGSPAKFSPMPLLEGKRVRFVGQAVAFIVAESLASAKDAAELIEIVYEPLPAVVSVDDALAPGAPQVDEDSPGNEAYSHQIGDPAATRRAFASAAHIVRDTIRLSRITGNAMEPRGCLARYDPDARLYTLRATFQSIHHIRNALANHIFKLPMNHFRLVCENMGGGFGTKGDCYPEYSLALWAAEVTGRPVKWVADRSESLQTDSHARGMVADTELALDAEGRFLAIRVRGRVTVGAYFTNDRATNPVLSLYSIANTYRFGAASVELTLALTNTNLVAPYRGGSRPEPIHVIETIVDRAAAELGIDPLDLRRRNLVGPEAMPYRSALGAVYDCGDFPGNLEECARLADYAGFAARREAATRRGKLLGIGIASVVAGSGGYGHEYAEIRFDPSGAVTLITGSMDHGQGHGTSFKQVLAERFGIDNDLIRYRFGDSDVVARGMGTWGSRSAMLGGAAITIAAERVIEKARRIAAHAMEASETDLVFEGGGFTITGTDRAMTIGEIARRSFTGPLPPGVEAGLSDTATFTPEAPTFPAGVHICEVEIDAETGQTEITRYCGVDDIGNVINPLLAEGQIVGGIVQGLGQALLEEIVYQPDSGQILTGSFQDYAMPRADDFGEFHLADRGIPTKLNPLGVKGVGEAGTLAALPAAMNAVNHALAAAGAGPITMPASPRRVWEALRAARV